MKIYTHTHSYRNTRTLSLIVCLVPGMSALRGLIHCSTQHIATYCNTPQHTPTPSNTLQHPPTHCNTLQHACGHTKEHEPSRYVMPCTHMTIYGHVYTQPDCTTLPTSRLAVPTAKDYHSYLPPCMTSLQHTATHGNTLHYSLYIPFTLYLPTETPRMSLSRPPSSPTCLQ